MTKTVIFIGYIRRAYLSYFAKNGYTIGLFQDISREDFAERFEDETAPEELLDFIFPINFQSQKNVEDSLKGVKFKEDVLLICLNDRYLLATAQIAKTLNLKQTRSLPIDLARNVTDKIYQRKLFKEKFPEISPEYKKIRTFHGAYTFTHKYGFPVIIKPANLSQSQLVNVCHDLEELIKKGSYVLDNVAEVYLKNQVYRTPQVSIEQFIQGQQFSVDSYATLDGKIIHTPICKQDIGYDLGMGNFETLCSYYVDDLTKDEEKLIFETINKAIKSLGIQGNPSHTEVRLTKEGKCQIVEVNIRTGGYRAEMLKLSYGINHVQNVINTYLGEKIEVENKLIKYSACPQIWSDKQGILKNISGLDKVKKLPSFVKIAVSAKNGTLVGPSDLGFPKIIFAILAHENKKTLETDIQKMRELIILEIEESKQIEEDWNF
jgi:biotin carboxylase